MIYDDYNIENGDTLYNIGKKFNINPDLLALINGLNIDDYIYKGQKIIVPKSEFSYYLTKSGDDLKEILKLFNSDYSNFSIYNDKIVLEEGQIFAYKR